jgi:hypothetical protein
MLGRSIDVHAPLARENATERILKHLGLLFTGQTEEKWSEICPVGS